MITSPRLWVVLQLIVLVVGGGATSFALSGLSDAHEHQRQVVTALESFELVTEAHIDDQLDYRSLRRVSSDTEALAEVADTLVRLEPGTEPAVDRFLTTIAEPSADERWWFRASSDLERVSQQALAPTGEAVRDARARTWWTLAVTGVTLGATVVGRHLVARGE